MFQPAQLQFLVKCQLKSCCYGNKSPLHPIYSSHPGALIPMFIHMSPYPTIYSHHKTFLRAATGTYGAVQRVPVCYQWVPRGHLRHPIASPIWSCPRQEICGWTGSKFASQNLARYMDIKPGHQLSRPSTQNLDLQ